MGDRENITILADCLGGHPDSPDALVGGRIVADGNGVAFLRELRGANILASELAEHREAFS